MLDPRTNLLKDLSLKEIRLEEENEKKVKKRRLRTHLKRKDDNLFGDFLFLFSSMKTQMAWLGV